MALLAASRNTPEWNGTPRIHMGLVGLEAATSIYVGGMVAADANGYGVPAQLLGAAPLNKLAVLGICEYVYAGGILSPGLNALNQTGNGLLYPGATGVLGAAGAIAVGVARGIFGMDQDGTISSLNVGALAFANDDHIVSLNDGSGGTTVPNTTSIVMPAAGTAQIVVTKPYIQPGSFSAYSATGGGGTKYVENTDYAIDYQAGLFIGIGGAIAAGATVFITYKYGLPTKVAAGEIIALDAGLVYVDFMKQSGRSLNAVQLQN